MDGSNETASASQRRREEIDDLLSGTFNSILRIEEQSLDNRLTHGLTITEVHTIVAIGLHERNPMNVVAARLGVTLATLTTAVSKLAGKGFVERSRAEDDRRKVLVSLTKKGRQVPVPPPDDRRGARRPHRGGGARVRRGAFQGEGVLRRAGVGARAARGLLHGTCRVGHAARCTSTNVSRETFVRAYKCFT